MNRDRTDPTFQWCTISFSSHFILDRSDIRHQWDMMEHRILYTETIPASCLPPLSTSSDPKRNDTAAGWQELNPESTEIKLKGLRKHQKS